MVLNQELWKADIIEVFYELNPFVHRAVNADESVLGGKIVIRELSPKERRERTNVHQGVTHVREAANFYKLNEFESGIIRITSDFSIIAASKEKRKGFLRDNFRKVFLIAGDEMIFDWSKETDVALNKVHATGIEHAFGETILAEEDIFEARNKLDSQNLPDTNRILLLTSEHSAHLRYNENLIHAFSDSDNLPKGCIGHLHGFDIYTRKNILRIGAGNVIKNSENAIEPGDKNCSLFYHASSAEYAIGETKIVYTPDDALYQSDTLSFLFHAGGRARQPLFVIS